MTDIVARARGREDAIVVSQVVLAEWWRGRSDWREAILAMLVVEPLTDARAKLAGEAVARVAGATTCARSFRECASSRSEVLTPRAQVATSIRWTSRLAGDVRVSIELRGLDPLG